MTRRIAVCGSVLLSVAAACGRGPEAPAAIDLIAELPSAERRAAGNVDQAVRVERLSGETAGDALVLHAPARVIWPLRIPDDATLTASAAIVPGTGDGATLRVGISDDRHYEGLLQLPLTPAEGGQPSWQLISIDLGKYAGWQWSLFYRPSDRTWKVIVNADKTPGATIALRAPRIASSR